MTWEGVEKRKISWEELWDIKAFIVSFTINADLFWCVGACIWQQQTKQVDG